MSEIILSENRPIVKSLLKWVEKRDTKTRIAKKMILAGYEKRGFIMMKCGDQMAIEYCQNCGAHHVRSTNLCRDKMCPVCRWRLSLKRYAQMVAVCDVLQAEYPSTEYKFLTLTIKNCAVDELNDTLKRMAKAWNRLLQRKLFKEHVQGWARSVEVTYNKQTGEVHPHYHVILMMNKLPQRGKAFNAGVIAKQWEKALELDYNPIIDLREIKQGQAADITGVVCETFKYSVKDNDLSNMPLELFSKFVAQMSSVRTTAFGGEIRKIRAELGLSDKSAEQINTNDETLIKCPKCGVDMQTAIFNWSNFDEGVRENGLRNILQKAETMRRNEVKSHA